MPVTVRVGRPRWLLEDGNDWAGNRIISLTPGEYAEAEAFLPRARRLEVAVGGYGVSNGEIFQLSGSSVRPDGEWVVRYRLQQRTTPIAVAEQPRQPSRQRLPSHSLYSIDH